MKLATLAHQPQHQAQHRRAATRAVSARRATPSSTSARRPRCACWPSRTGRAGRSRGPRQRRHPVRRRRRPTCHPRPAALQGRLRRPQLQHPHPGDGPRPAAVPDAVLEVRRHPDRRQRRHRPPARDRRLRLGGRARGRHRHAGPPRHAPRRPRRRSPASRCSTTSPAATGSSAPVSGCRARTGTPPPRSAPTSSPPTSCPAAYAPSSTCALTVDGEVMQSDTTGDLLFDPVALVEYVSTMVRLNPGDLIATGTPGGVGPRPQPEALPRRRRDRGRRDRGHRPSARTSSSRTASADDRTAAASDAAPESIWAAAGLGRSRHQARPPRRSPGWTRRRSTRRAPCPAGRRKHLVAHLAANADAVGNLVHWAATGDAPRCTPRPSSATPTSRPAARRTGERAARPGSTPRPRGLPRRWAP